MLFLWISRLDVWKYYRVIRPWHYFLPMLCFSRASKMPRLCAPLWLRNARDDLQRISGGLTTAIIRCFACRDQLEFAWSALCLQPFLNCLRQEKYEPSDLRVSGGKNGLQIRPAINLLYPRQRVNAKIWNSSIYNFKILLWKCSWVNFFWKNCCDFILVFPTRALSR